MIRPINKDDVVDENIKETITYKVINYKVFIFIIFLFFGFALKIKNLLISRLYL